MGDRVEGEEANPDAAEALLQAKTNPPRPEAPVEVLEAVEAVRMGLSFADAMEDPVDEPLEELEAAAAAAAPVAAAVAAAAAGALDVAVEEAADAEGDQLHLLSELEPSAGVGVCPEEEERAELLPLRRRVPRRRA